MEHDRTTLTQPQYASSDRHTSLLMPHGESPRPNQMGLFVRPWLENDPARQPTAVELGVVPRKRMKREPMLWSSVDIQ